MLCREIISVEIDNYKEHVNGVYYKTQCSVMWRQRELVVNSGF